MASKKAGRLAGLAALAGLAYMNKDKLFGAKGETKAAAPAATEKSRTYAETAEDEDAETGRLMRANQMRARGEAEGKKIDGSDRFAGPATTKDTEFGDLEGAMKRNAETKTTPAKVARSEKAPSASASSGTSRFSPRGSPVLSDNPRKIGNAKAVVAEGGDRSARADMSSPSQTERFAPSGSPVLSDNPRKIGNAKAVVAEGGDRSARADMSSPNSGSGSGGRTPRSDAPSSGLGGVRRPGTNVDYENKETSDMSTGKRGGVVKKMASGGMTSSASKRGDGIASKGKTRGRMC